MSFELVIREVRQFSKPGFQTRFFRPLPVANVEHPLGAAQQKFLIVDVLKVVALLALNVRLTVVPIPVPVAIPALVATLVQFKAVVAVAMDVAAAAVAEMSVAVVTVAAAMDVVTAIPVRETPFTEPVVNSWLVTRHKAVH
ncbi:MAG: hypothetical protein KDA65_18650 [Planctomycetaceae bacterium]|nr:hypothetical protein [Planctomycetaceae bacterium]